jgi:hypothetical protein
MEMAHGKKPKTERAAWVPESILDDDVSHFMGAAAAAKKAGKSHFDFGGKKYKVTMKHDTAKKVDESADAISEATFATDIDYNEEDDIKKVAKRFGVKVGFVNIGGATEMQMTGDKNKIMKALKALEFTDQEIKNAYFKESAECPTCRDGECQCDQPVEEAKVDEVSYKTAMKSYQKAMGQSKDADTTGDKETGDKKFDQAVKFGRYANKKFQSSRNKKKLVGTLTKEETVEEFFELTERVEKIACLQCDEVSTKKAWEKNNGFCPKCKTSSQGVAESVELDSVEENLAPGATAQHSATKETSDTWDKQMSNGENDIPMGKKKDFVDQHTMEVAYDAEAIYKQNKYEALSKTPARPGDKSDGDKNVVNPIPTNMVDGMRAALAKMKNSGE